jgi:isoaspartyl peptidase/L-asparaginase-like protein (Ntn-hydrolase superfamily)
MVSWAIALHGGAGMIAKENMTSDWKKRTEAALNEILNIGVVALENNLTAVETVELVVSTNSNLHFTFSTALHSLAMSSHNYTETLKSSS